MTSILSAITGQLIQSLLLSTFMPVVIFIILFQIFVAPLLLTEGIILRPLEVLDPQWQVLALLIASILLTGLLYNLNTPLIRLYEGYSWKDSCIGKWRINFFKNKLQATQARCRGMRTLLRELGRANSRYKEIQKEWQRLRKRLNSELPEKENLILPTRLGNVIRSFEYYSTLWYCMDAVTLWPLLVAKIDKDYAAILDGAKASFDFMINSSCLSFILAVIVLYAGWRYPSQIEITWVIKLISFLFLAYLFYIGSIGRAKAWGSLVKGAFDLYRGDLLKQLGYHFFPMDERMIWNKVSRQMIYSNITDQPPFYKYTPRFAQGIASDGSKEEIDIQITRGFSYPNESGFTVNIEAKNIDDRKRDAINVTITDTVPDGFEYVWDSAQVNFQSIPVSGTNPYQFKIGDLPYNVSILLTYNVINFQN